MQSLRRSALSALLIIITAATVAACGFHLRGSQGNSVLPFKTIFLGFPATSTLGNELRRYIDGSDNTKVVDDRKMAEASVDILSETRDKVVLSVNSQGRVREYTLYYRLNFVVKDSTGKNLLGPMQVVSKREFSYNESQILAKESEEARVYRDMQSDLVQQLLRRLAAIKPIKPT